MSKIKDPHPIHVILRDWSKDKKANTPAAETHTKNSKKKGD